MLVSHKEVINKNFNVKYTGNKKVKIGIKISKMNLQIRDYFYKWINQNSYDQNKIILITGIIFLNISPLHHYPYSNFLF